MSTFIELPTPLSGDSIGPGYIVTDPFNDAVPSSFSLRPDHQPDVHTKERSHITQDANDGPGNTKSMSQRKDSVMLAAEDSTHITLAHAQSFFNALRNNPKAHAFLSKAAVQHDPLFYITGVQLVTQSSLLAEASAGTIRPPMHVTTSTWTTTSGTITAVESSKVKCRVGSADEPHALDDLEYDWSYHGMEDGVQLSIGLGKRVRGEDLKGKEEGKDEQEDWMDESWDYNYSDDDDNGLGGF